MCIETQKHSVKTILRQLEDRKQGNVAGAMSKAVDG